MIIQVCNIVSGFVLAAPKLADKGIRQQIENLSTKLDKYKIHIGWTTLVIGVTALLNRIGILPLGWSSLGSSYPQSIPAVLIGLVFCAKSFEKYPTLYKFIAWLTSHQFLLGLIGILNGLGSLLFGCWMPVFCTILL